MDLQYENKIEGNIELRLDARDLKIRSVTLGGEEIPHCYDDEKKTLLAVFIPPDQGKKTIRIEYEIPGENLSWFATNQGKIQEHPQIESWTKEFDNLSWIPTQHSLLTPMTYSWVVKTNDPKLMALTSSCKNPQETSEEGVYKFYMDRPTLPVFMNFAVGNYVYVPFDERCGVYCEPNKVSEVKEHMMDLPKWVDTAEELLGELPTGSYNPLIVRNGCHYVFMEGAGFSCFSKEMIYDQRTIGQDLAFHLFSHAVTTGSWGEELWSQGMDEYFSFRIAEKVLDEKEARFNLKRALCSQMERQKELEADASTRDEKLKLCSSTFEGTLVPLKMPSRQGSLFFFMLEEAMGRKYFDRMLLDCRTVFSNKGLNKERFLKFLSAWLEQSDLEIETEDFFKKNHIVEWLESPKRPENCPKIESKEWDQVQRLIQAVNEGEDVLREIRELSEYAQEQLFLNLNWKEAPSSLLRYFEGIPRFQKMDYPLFWSLIYIEREEFSERALEKAVDLILEENDMNLIYGWAQRLKRHGEKGLLFFQRVSKQLASQSKNEVFSSEGWANLFTIINILGNIDLRGGLV